MSNKVYCLAEINTLDYFNREKQGFTTLFVNFNHALMVKNEFKFSHSFNRFWS